MFFIDLDVGDLVSIREEMKDAGKKVMRDAGQRLINMTRAHIIEQANKRLHSRRQMYIDGLKHFQVDDDTYVVSLDAKVRWIDDGLQPFNMIEGMLKSKKAKTAKDGSKYLVVPFEQNKGPTQMTPAQQSLLDTVKQELANRKIPYGSIEKDSKGEAKLGKLHGFDITTAPLKSHDGPGQGHGAIGQVRQGPTGIPFLKGVSVYQQKIKNKDGSTGVKRSIMTFRVVSSKMQGQGRWDHPGLSPVHLMDEAYTWAMQQWEQVIVPDLLEAFANET